MTVRRVFYSPILRGTSLLALSLLLSGPQSRGDQGARRKTTSRRPRRRSAENKPDDALASLDAALKEDPDNAAAHFWRGRLRAGKRDLDKALPDFNATHPACSRRAMPMRTAVTFFRRRANRTTRWRISTRRCGWTPTTTSRFSCAVCSSANAATPRRRSATSTRRSTLQPDNREALQGRGQIYVLRRELDAALRDFDRCIQLDPRDPAGHTGRGGVNYLKGDFKEAIEDYTQAVELLPKDRTPADAARLRLRRRRGDGKGARRFRRRAGDQPARTHPPCSGRAEIRRSSKQWKEALADYEKLLGLAPGDYRALLGTASALVCLGRIGEGARRCTASSIQRYPTEAQPFNDYAWLLATGTKDSVRNGQRAVELASQACKLTEYKNAGYLDTLAAAFAEKGEFCRRDQVAGGSGEGGGDRSRRKCRRTSSRASNSTSRRSRIARRRSSA